MTVEEMAALGDYAETVLTNPTFNQILNEWDKATVEVMLSTKPHQMEEREKTFQAVWAVREFLGFMQQFVKTKYDMMQPEKPEDYWDDPDSP